MRRILLALLLSLTTLSARAEGARAGDFDYYVMALSWSANWCALEGDARNSPQITAGSCTASGPNSTAASHHTAKPPSARPRAA